MAELPTRSLLRYISTVSCGVAAVGLFVLVHTLVGKNSRRSGAVEDGAAHRRSSVSAHAAHPVCSVRIPCAACRMPCIFCAQYLRI